MLFLQSWDNRGRRESAQTLQKKPKNFAWRLKLQSLFCCGLTDELSRNEKRFIDLSNKDSLERQFHEKISNTTCISHQVLAVMQCLQI